MLFPTWKRSYRGNVSLRLDVETFSGGLDVETFLGHGVVAGNVSPSEFFARKYVFSAKYAKGFHVETFPR